MKTTKTGQIDRRSTVATAQAAAMTPEQREARAKAGAAARWEESIIVADVTAASFADVQRMAKRIHRRYWAITPNDASKKSGTFTAGTKALMVSGTWRVV